MNLYDGIHLNQQVMIWNECAIKVDTPYAFDEK